MTDVETLTTPTSTLIETNGIKLHVMQAGDPNGEPVILLHGFPEFWYGWERQIAPLVEAGYRVIVPDQRGYNLSDKPEGVNSYRVTELVADVIGLIDALGYDKVRLGAHDWGAVVAWYVALWYPERLSQLVIANVPHPHVYQKFIRTNPAQMFKSWYIGFFQVPGLSEGILSAGNFGAFSQLMREQAGMDEATLDVYREAWGQPGALTAMINWYRGLVRNPPQDNTDGRVTVPTLMVWGMDDVALTYEMAEPSIEMCDAGKLVLFKNTSHFVQHQKAERVAALMIDFFENGLEDESNAESSAG